MGSSEASSSSSSWRCSVVGRLLFSWFDGYVAMGRARALTADEIPELEEEFRYMKLRMRGRAETKMGWDCTYRVAGQSACGKAYVHCKFMVNLSLSAILHGRDGHGNDRGHTYLEV